jgi:hypothetical protein
MIPKQAFCRCNPLTARSLEPHSDLPEQNTFLRFSTRSRISVFSIGGKVFSYGASLPARDSPVGDSVRWWCGMANQGGICGVGCGDPDRRRRHGGDYPPIAAAPRGEGSTVTGSSLIAPVSLRVCRPSALSGIAGATERPGWRSRRVPAPLVPPRRSQPACLRRSASPQIDRALLLGDSWRQCPFSLLCRPDGENRMHTRLQDGVSEWSVPFWE